jgi:hypothetical protein
MPSETGVAVSVVMLGTTTFGSSGWVVCESIDATFGAATLVRATDCELARGELWRVTESAVKATTPRTAADIAPAVSVLATL